MNLYHIETKIRVLQFFCCTVEVVFRTVLGLKNIDVYSTERKTQENMFYHISFYYVHSTMLNVL